ncbi:MAG: bifunctional folylpolyglutamate synthase/dihydrofolate synthase [Chitinophagales bacterium]|nr:bifunctional folylpolyglutamate synthase/dihydrofolate synthase [Chitinophagales bacterium]
MNYEETIAFLYSQLPMYSRIGKAAYKSDLINTRRLCALLNNPEQSFRSIHIAGTNGKGSTSHMLAAILQQNGYKTGLYTSPHLKDFRERIRINGQLIPETEVVKFVMAYKEKVLEIGCSFFEWSVGLAFDYFRKENVDIAVIETGLGGRLDSTNVITPLLSLITNISFDHTDLLGDSLEKIAKEKAGIIKNGVPVVIGEHSPETDPVFIETAKEKAAAINFAGDNWTLLQSSYKDDALCMKIEHHSADQWDIEIDLLGKYQEKNILGVLEAQWILSANGFNLTKQNCIAALKSVKQLTGLAGRWDILSASPLIIADVAHNEAGIFHAMDQLKHYHYQQLHIAIGFVSDKDLSKLLSHFPKDATYYFCKPDIPRGLDASMLQAIAHEYGLHGKVYPSVTSAFEAAKEYASANDLIYVGGSTFVVAEINRVIPQS